MFRKVSLEPGEARAAVDIFVGEARVRASEGDSVAMALLGAGVVPFRRTPVSGEARAPLCLMGVCFECLVEIDGVQNVQSCMVTVREGMKVRLQRGARDVGAAP